MSLSTRFVSDLFITVARRPLQITTNRHHVNNYFLLFYVDNYYMVDTLASPSGNIMKLFKESTKEEETPFREWARINYTPFSEIKGVWHPVIQEECAKINADAQIEKSLAREYYPASKIDI